MRTALKPERSLQLPHDATTSVRLDAMTFTDPFPHSVEVGAHRADVAEVLF